MSERPAYPTQVVMLDDDPDVGIAAQLLLQRRIGPVECVRRPAELFAVLERLRPALLLLDLNFGPGRTDGAQGLRLLEEVRARVHPPVVVVLTAFADIEIAVRALKRGAFDFITKPWDNVRLVATCNEALASLSTSRQQSSALEGHTETVLPLAVQERAAVIAALTESQGNVAAAARTLGLSRAALYRRLARHGL